jgi:hypothetical protein
LWLREVVPVADRDHLRRPLPRRGDLREASFAPRPVAQAVEEIR